MINTEKQSHILLRSCKGPSVLINCCTEIQRHFNGVPSDLRSPNCASGMKIRKRSGNDFVEANRADRGYWSKTDTFSAFRGYHVDL